MKTTIATAVIAIIAATATVTFRVPERGSKALEALPQRALELATAWAESSQGGQP